MPLTISAAATIEKNKLCSDGAWLVLLEIALPGQTIHLVRNNENIIWRGIEWAAFPFDIDDIEENTKGEVQSLNVKVSNVTRTIQAYLEPSGGATGTVVKIYFKMSKGLSEASAEVEEVFAVTKTSVTAEWVTFSLGAGYPLSVRRPEKRVFKNFCQFQYCGIECGLPESMKTTYPDCKRTLTDCRTRGNSTRFNGEPAIPGGLYLEET